MSYTLFGNTNEIEGLRYISNSKELLKKIKGIDKTELLSNKEQYIEIFKQLVNQTTKEVDIEIFKQFGKLDSTDISDYLKNTYNKINDTLVKRECLSAIGRLRQHDNIEFFEDILKNEIDPKLLLQAIRSLLVFRKDEKIKTILENFKDHPNEMIQEVINIEFFKKDRSNDIHSEVDPKLENIVVNGDVIEVLKTLKEEKIHLTFTSPPYYNARDYSIYASYEEYLNFLRDVFKEVHRVTKNGRFLIVNSSPVIVPRVSRNHSSKRYPIPFDLNSILIQDGWEFIDDIIWKKPEYSVKNRIGGFMQHRKPLGYKPNSVTEYLMVYRKKSADLIDWNMKQYDEATIKESKVDDDYETTNVWEIEPTIDKVHSAVFPKGLCKRVVEYYSFKGDLIFDPFGGSGTLADVALDLERKIFTTELNKDYFERIKDKLKTKTTSIKYKNLKDFKEWIFQDQ